MTLDDLMWWFFSIQMEVYIKSVRVTLWLPFYNMGSPDQSAGWKWCIMIGCNIDRCNILNLFYFYYLFFVCLIFFFFNSKRANRKTILNSKEFKNAVVFHKLFCASILLTVGYRGTRFNENYTCNLLSYWNFRNITLIWRKAVVVL